MIRILKKSLIFFLLAILVLPVFALAEERILDFKSDIKIPLNAELLVKEMIVVQSEAKSIKHGIYRDFPTVYQDDYGKRTKIDFQVIEVMRDGVPEPFSVSDLSNGKRIYIGDAKKLLPVGQHGYSLTYKVNKEIGFFNDHDELYWNVTGNGWEFPIDNVEATVNLPTGANMENVTYTAYTGLQGERGGDYSVYSTTTDDVFKVIFNSTRGFSVGEGLTIVVGWPKGLVIAPTQAEQSRNFLVDNLGAIIAFFGLLIIFLYYFVVWLVVGRDPRKGVIIPLYEPPLDMTPSAVRYLLTGYDDKSLAASIIYLAVNGYLKIDKKLSSFYLIKTEGKNPANDSEEKIIMDSLFSGGNSLRLEKSIGTSEKISFAKKDLISLLNRDYGKYKIVNWKFNLFGVAVSLLVLIGSVISMAPNLAIIIFFSLWLSIWTVAVAVLALAVVSGWSSIIKGYGSWPRTVFITLFSLPFFAAEIFAIFAITGMGLASLLIVVCIILLIIVNAVFSLLLGNVTVEGRKLIDKIEGFKWFLSVTEKDRLNFSHPPELTPQLFEKFLPYALALGVENKWAEQFAEVFAMPGGEYHPSWCNVPLSHVSDINSFTNSFSSSVSSSSLSPGSSSGFGGGGSSGGGGGGGGGGW